MRIGGSHLCLCVADDLTQVIASDGESVAVTIAELSTTNLSIGHTFIVKVLDLDKAEEREL